MKTKKPKEETTYALDCGKCPFPHTESDIGEDPNQLHVEGMNTLQNETKKLNQVLKMAILFMENWIGFSSYPSTHSTSMGLWMCSFVFVGLGIFSIWGRGLIERCDSTIRTSKQGLHSEENPEHIPVLYYSQR